MRKATVWMIASWIAFSACDGGDRDLPARYHSLEVPTARLRDPETQRRGAELFAKDCALCHGKNADGDGLRKTGFARPPTNFRDPAWQRRATPRRVFAIIREGVPGSGMPAWVALDREQTWDLVAYVLTVGEERSS